MKSLIIGAGEVGESLRKVLSPYHQTYIRDIAPVSVKDIEVLHICFPDSIDFIYQTRDYIEFYEPKLTVINSSVKVGTTDAINRSLVYSPIRGRHPNLEKEMKIFPKFLASKNKKSLEMAKKYFERCGWQTYLSNHPHELEYVKLISNIHMGLEISWRQEVERMLHHFKISPKTYESWEKTYNKGYLDLGQFNLIRSFMKPNPIGGHCIIPCTEILLEQYPSDLLDFILESNENAKRCA